MAAESNNDKVKSTASAGPPTQRCVARKQEIPAGASLCPTCRSYQRAWKNSLRYVAGIAALFVLIISGAAWLWNTVNTLFPREEVSLVACNTLDSGSVVVVNRGDNEVFLTRSLLWMAGRTSNWVAPRFEINEKLPPGQFLKREFNASRIKGNASFVRGFSETDFQKLITQAATGDPCVEAVFFCSGDGDLRDLQQMAGPTLNTFPVAGYLEYWGRAGSASRIQITGTGLICEDASRSCATEPHHAP